MQGVSTLLLVAVFQMGSCSGAESPSSCPPQWTEFRHRCFGFYPVWSTWSSAKSLCSQTGGDLVSLHTPDDRRFISQLVGVDAVVWLGGYWTPQKDSWFWTDGSSFRGDVWTDRPTGKSTENTACVEMTTKSGEVNSAPCGELRFYICSSKANPLQITLGGYETELK
uniref:C-type lectin domain-containing protein n=1 Tax=Sphaeramia orbicularis TaxID=375764 RepID=A0A673AAA9_9TELE